MAGTAAHLRALSRALRVLATLGDTAEVASLLADGRADPAAEDNGALALAVASGHVAVVEALLRDGRADPAACRCCLLGQAARDGNTAILQALLADGRADPAAQRSYSLRTAAFNGQAAAVAALLVDGRADPAACRAEALHMALIDAARTGCFDIVHALLNDGRACLRDVDYTLQHLYACARKPDGRGMHALQPLLQCLSRRQRWVQRRPWLRAGV
jgi:ankyrin repeat protein